MRSLPWVIIPDIQVGSRKSTWKWGWGSPGKGLQPGSITNLFGEYYGMVTVIEHGTQLPDVRVNYSYS